MVIKTFEEMCREVSSVKKIRKRVSDEIEGNGPVMCVRRFSSFFDCWEEGRFEAHCYQIEAGFVWGELEEEMCFEPVDLSDFTHGDFPSYPRNWMGYEGFAVSIPIKYGFVKLGPSFGAKDEIAKIRMVGRGKIGFMMDEFSNDSPLRGPIRPYLESIDLLIGGREVKEYLRRKRGRHSASDIRRITELFGADL